MNCIRRVGLASVFEWLIELSNDAIFYPDDGAIERIEAVEVGQVVGDCYSPHSHEAPGQVFAALTMADADIWTVGNRWLQECPDTRAAIISRAAIMRY